MTRRVILVLLALATPAVADPCKQVGDAPVTVATAGSADDYALTINIESASPTSWGTAGNEAVVLEVSGQKRGLIGHLIVHQGNTKFDYTMHVGALAAGEAVQVKVSPLTAPKAKHDAIACATRLAAISTLGAIGEGIANAPIFRWPVQKSFNDVPLVVGWSKSHHAYQTVMTNEDGGTAEQCGGGARGMQAEIARWGRSTDIEGHYSYAATPTWERCTGKVDVKTTPLRTEGAHPILYWGDGHNRLFESRAGYGHACGSRKPEKPDGDLDGWSIRNTSSELADDAGKVIILRPLPVDLDALGYQHFGGRREALSDSYAPWMYRITSLELAREGKIDDARTFAMDRYLYVDVQVANVGGAGGTYCAKTVSGGFKLRVTTKRGATIDSPQITKPYASGGQHDWKRVAIALPAGVTAADVDHFTFDAYDNDGIYVTALGDAFIPKPDGANGAKLDYVRKGTKAYSYYVDDDSSGCTNGTNTAGPGGTPYRCVGGDVTLAR
jgi:hypothetical protein